MVHSKKVDRSTHLSVVSTQTIMSGPVLPEDIFVSTSSPSQSWAGRVHRIWFHDHIRGQYAEVDVLLCDERTCAVCNTSLPPLPDATTLQQRQSCPLMHEDELAMVPHQGLTFQPGRQLRELPNTGFGHGYVQYVTFMGGKRVLLDVIYQPAVEESSNRRLDILNFLS